jgi:hypothetical protein
VEVEALPAAEREAIESSEREAVEQAAREESARLERERIAGLGSSSSSSSASGTGTSSPATSSGSSGASIEVKGFKAAVAPDATVIGASARVGASGVFWLTLSCPAGETRCAGSITLTLARGHGRGAAAGSRVTSAYFTLAGGKQTRVRLALIKRIRVLLARLRSRSGRRKPHSAAEDHAASS